MGEITLLLHNRHPTSGIAPQSIPRVQDQLLFKVYDVSGTGLDEETPVEELGILQKRKKDFKLQKIRFILQQLFPQPLESLVNLLPAPVRNLPQSEVF